MDIGQALAYWAACDGERDCEKCPLFDPNPDNFSVCNLFSEAHMILDAQGLFLYMN